MATEKIKYLEDEKRAQVEEPKGTSFEETQVAYAPTPVAEDDWRNVPGDWKTAKGSSRKTLTEIREEQFESYRKSREKGASQVRENPTVEQLKVELEKTLEEAKKEEKKETEKKAEPAKKATASKK